MNNLRIKLPTTKMKKNDILNLGSNDRLFDRTIIIRSLKRSAKRNKTSESSYLKICQSETIAKIVKIHCATIKYVYSLFGCSKRFCWVVIETEERLSSANGSRLLVN